MGFFRKKISNDMVPIHPDNVANKDWIILLEESTIIGPSPERIRVAGWLQEKKIVKKYDMFLRKRYFVVVEGYNPRIHALYFCPQLFRYDSGKLVPLQGEEIGQLIAPWCAGSQHPADAVEDTSVIPRRTPRALFGNIGLMAAHS